MDRLFLFIARAGFGTSMPIPAPCRGSLIGLLLWLVIAQLDSGAYLTVLAALFIIGAAAAGAAEKITDEAKPDMVIIDAVVGQLTALSLLDRPLPVLATLAVFCLLNRFKPFPADWIEHHLHGGLAIMLDDTVIGIYTLLLVRSGSALFF